LSYSGEWEEATIASQNDTYLTAQEAKEVHEAMNRLVQPYRDRQHDASLRPPGSLRYEVMLFGYPLSDPPATEP
jgi:hypothetical protein